MKLLLDQNLSRRIVGRIDPLYPGSRHLQHFGLDRADDEVVWGLAARDGFVIVTKDADFHFRSLTRGHPPKLIYLCVGNCPTREIVDVLVNNVETIRAFLANPDESFIMF